MVFRFCFAQEHAATVRGKARKEPVYGKVPKTLQLVAACIMRGHDTRLATIKGLKPSRKATNLSVIFLHNMIHTVLQL